VRTNGEKGLLYRYPRPVVTVNAKELLKELSGYREIQKYGDGFLEES
jgi:hypothetical protein